MVSVELVCCVVRNLALCAVVLLLGPLRCLMDM